MKPRSYFVPNIVIVVVMLFFGCRSTVLDVKKLDYLNIAAGSIRDTLDERFSERGWRLGEAWTRCSIDGENFRVRLSSFLERETGEIVVDIPELYIRTENVHFDPWERFFDPEETDTAWLKRFYIEEEQRFEKAVYEHFRNAAGTRFEPGTGEFLSYLEYRMRTFNLMLLEDKIRYFRRGGTEWRTRIFSGTGKTAELSERTVNRLGFVLNHPGGSEKIEKELEEYP